MIVVCEGCERRFQVDDARIPERGARVRCKRCKHRFRVLPPGSAVADSAPDADPGDDSIDGEQTLAGTTVPPADDASVELRFVTEPPAAPGDPEEPSDEDGSADDVPAPGEQTIGEGSWEFGDSSLSFDEETTSEPPAAPVSSQSFIDAIPDDEGMDTAPPEPVAPPPQPEAPIAGEDSTFRAVAPVDGAESVMFEMPEDPPRSVPLELAEDEESVERAPEPAREVAEEPVGEAAPEPVREAAPEPVREAAPEPVGEAAEEPMRETPPEPVQEPPPEPTQAASPEPVVEPATPPTAAAAQEDCQLPEIGSAEDWDRLARDGSPEASVAPRPAAPAPSEPAADECLDFSDLDEDPDPDWPNLSADGETPTEAPPAPRRGGSAWLEHAGWALSLVMLLSVAQGTVRVAPQGPGVPPGQLVLYGLSAENVRGRFIDNARSGTLFIVSGELHNRGTAPLKAGGALQLVLLDAAGRALETQPVPVGPMLPEQALREDPAGALAKRQRARASELAATELAPGGHMAFDAVVAELSADAVRFRVEPVAR